MDSMLIDTPEKLGWEILGNALNLRVEEKLEDTYATFTLNFMGIAYSLQVPKHEMQDASNWRAAWGQLIQDCALRHAMGNQKLYKHGSREMTEDEAKALEDSKPSSLLKL